MANFAELGIRINSDSAQTAATDLDNLTSAGARAESSLNKLSGSDGKRASSARQVNKAFREQQQELSKLLGSINPAVAALDRLDQQERKLAQFRKSGAVDTQTYKEYTSILDSQRNALGRVDDMQKKAGLSAKQLAFATRGLPAQFTDIAVSLQGGQRPLSVLLQQGGQLKDMFGGIGPAARAMGGYIAGLINPFTVAAAAVTLLAVAWKQGSDESVAFNKALIETGSYAGKNVDQLNELAIAFDKLDGVTRGKAAQGIAEVAASGKFVGEQFDIASKAAVEWEAATGTAVADTVAQFAKLKDDPVKTLLEMNDRMHFLTQAQLDNVKSLEEQGRAQEAATEAFRIAATVYDERSKQIVSNLGTLEASWKFVGDAAKHAWDFMLGIGRDTTLSDKILNVQKQLEEAQNPTSLEGAFDAGPKKVRELQAQLIALRQQQAGQNMKFITGDAMAGSSAEESAKNAWKDQVARYDETKRRELDIAKIRHDAALAGITDQKEVQKVIDAYTKKMDDAASKRIKQPKQAKENRDETSAQTLIEQTKRQISANEQIAVSGEKVSATENLIIKIRQDLADTTNKMTTAQRESLQAYIPTLESSEKAAKAATDEAKAKEALTKQTFAFATALENQQRQNEADLMTIGSGGNTVEMLNRQLSIRREYEDELQRIRNLGVASDSESYIQQTKNAETQLNKQLELERIYQEQRLSLMSDWRNGATAAFQDYAAQASDVAGQTKDVFSSAFDNLENQIVQGKLSFSSFADSIIKDLARIAAKQLIVGALGGIGGGGGTTGTIGSLAGGFLNFANGGYTGPGGKYDERGTVHAGEVVFSQADVSRHGGVQRVEAMRTGRKGYADGGIVGGASGGYPGGVEINNYSNGTTTTREETTKMPNGQEFKKLVVDIISADTAAGGKTWGATAQRGGLKTAR